MFDRENTYGTTQNKPIVYNIDTTPLNIPCILRWSQSISLFTKLDPVELFRYNNTITIIALALEVRLGFSIARRFL
jgi:hypothetical protein